jgi:hypothetical protein
MGKKNRIRIWIRDEQPESYFRELKNQFFWLKYLNSLTRIWDGKNSDPGSGMEKHPDPGWGDKHPGSAALSSSFPHPEPHGSARYLWLSSRQVRYLCKALVRYRKFFYNSPDSLRSPQGFSTSVSIV